MTLEIGILFAILAVMAYLFFTEKLPIDLTAFLGLVTLVLGGYVKPGEAFQGFASPAVITMLSVFFVSTALLNTGLADLIGRRVHALVGTREAPLLVVIMLASGVLSAFMNNIAAAAVLLPAVAGVARSTGVPPSRLFMPLSFGAILGGTTTLVGTPPNILAADLLRQHGFAPFRLFDFTPIGLTLLLVGVAYMAIFRRQLLPEGTVVSAETRTGDLVRAYQLQETLFSLRIPEGSKLDGLTLREARLGTALGTQVISILRGGRRRLAPRADTVLAAGDALLVQGRAGELPGLFRVQGVEIEEARPGDLTRTPEGADAKVATVGPDSPLVGQTLREARFRAQYGATVVGLRRDGTLLGGEVADQRVQAGDELLVLGTPLQLEGLAAPFDVAQAGVETLEELSGRHFVLHVPERSALAGATIAESRMGELVGLTVSGIVREGRTVLAPAPTDRIAAGDRLFVTGDPDRIRDLLRVGHVELRTVGAEEEIQSGDVGIVEAIVAPRSQAAGATLAELDFRERHGLQVLAIWREGHAIHAGLAKQKLRVGDALLLQGPWSRIRLLGSAPDFVVLAAAAQEPRRTSKMPFALAGLLVLVSFVVTGFQPIHVAAFAAATFVVLGGAITMEEAYRGVEWRAVFLVAAILPVGAAMERTGAALLLANAVTSIAGPLGPYAVLAGLCALSSLLSQCLDGAPAVVLLTPVSLQVAEQLSLSPYPIMMGVSLAASAAFMTPFSHKANLIVMGAGGYRVADYLRAGTPLTVVVLAILVLVVPVLFPFR